MSFGSIEYLFEFLVEFNEVGINANEGWELRHDIKLLIQLVPFKVIKPICRVGSNINGSTRTSKEESPFIHVNFIVTEQDFSCQKEREEQLILLEERSADVLVQ